jgi:tetratricopeptide (TPR) repeat protein
MKERGTKNEERGTLPNLQFAICNLQYVLLLLGLFALSGCAPGLDPRLAQNFQAAQTAFDRAAKPEEFVKVAAMYQEMIDDGAISGAVFYNQGNAWMRAKQPGRAIAAYRQAQRYRPRDPYLEANLQYALGPSASARRPVIEIVLFWQNWLGYAEKFYAAGGAAVLTFCFATIMLFTSRRQLWRRLVLAGAAVTILLIVSAGYDWYRFDCVVHGVITQSDVVARKGNAESYEPALNEKLSEGTEFRVMERRGDWLLIRLPGGQEGWIDQRAAVTYGRQLID